MPKKATEQAMNVSPRSGVAPPVDKQFGQPNGNLRHNGAWKKEDTARYKLEQMMKLTDRELRALVADDDAPLIERKLAQCIDCGDWKSIEGMINQVYGKPTERIEHKVIEPKPILDLTKKNKRGRA